MRSYSSPRQRNRKVTIWARVQLLLGLKVVSLVPLVTPLATAHSTARVVGVSRHVGEGIHATGSGRFLAAPQEAHALRTGTGRIRGELPVAGARGDALLNGQQYSVVIIGVSGNVYKGHFRALGLGAVLLFI